MPRKATSERQIRSQILKQKIRDASWSLIRDKGYDAVTIDDICAAVGVTKGTFYNHFSSKEQPILDNIVVDNLHYRNNLRPQVKKMKPGLGKLRAFLRLAIAYESGREKAMTGFSYKYRIADLKSSPPVIPDKREFFRILDEFIAEGQQSGEIRRDVGSSELAQVVLYSIRGLVYSWCLPDTHFDLREKGEDLLAVLIEGLRPGSLPPFVIR